MQFVRNAKGIFQRSRMEKMKFILYATPIGKLVMDLLDIPVFKPDETQWFSNIIKATMEARKKSTSKRNDIIDLMLQAVKEGANYGKK